MTTGIRRKGRADRRVGIALGIMTGVLAILAAQPVGAAIASVAHIGTSSDPSHSP